MSAILRHPIALWAGFVLAHLWLGMLALYAPGQPIGDVTQVYRYWIVDYAFAGHGWVGIDTVWVYPILAIVPMIAAAAFGPELYASTWLSLVMAVDAIAFAAILTIGRRNGAVHPGWWWLGFLVALGPVAVGRIDSITVPLAILGMLVVLTRPVLGGVLLTVAAWIKVWPAALVAAVVLALRDRVRVIVGAAATTAVVVIPNFSYSTSAGALAPKPVMPTKAPSSPMKRSQPCWMAASTATRTVPRPITEAWYLASCWKKSSKQGAQLYTLQQDHNKDDCYHIPRSCHK